MLTPAQQAQRLEGITATDASAILGQHPYRSAIDVWREKRGESKPSDDNERTKWGNLLEPVIRKDYEERHGMRVTIPGTLCRNDAEWMIATPDGIAYRGADAERGLEIKCHTVRLAYLYGEPGTDEVPAHELCQCMWSMGVTGLPRWDLVAFIDNWTNEYPIDADPELIGIMRDRCERFFVDNVKGGAMPEPDGSEAYTKYLRSKWPAHGVALVDIGDDLETFDLIERGRALRAEIGDREDELDALEQALKLKIADNAGLRWRDAHGKELRLTWKWQHRTDVDFAGIVATMMHSAALVVSGRNRETETALRHLKKIGTLVGSPSGDDIAALIVELRKTLIAIAKNVSEPEHTKKTPIRSMKWPAAWNRSKTKASKAKEH